MDKDRSFSEELHKDDLIVRERQERAQRILTVEKEMKGEYWKIIRSKLEAWIVNAEKRRRHLLDTGISEKNLRELNDEKVRMETLAQVLKINESIIYENKTWLDRVKEPLSKIVRYVQTFVGYGRNPDELSEQNGG